MQQPNATSLVEVTRDELPMYCPTPEASLWNSHPRQFIPLQDSDECSCSYCGTVFRLVESKSTPASADGTEPDQTVDSGAPSGGYVHNDG